MVTAKWKGVVIAQSDQTVVVEGNHYFPAESIKEEHFQPSSHQTTCGWKGIASYKSIVVEDEVNENAAWFYDDPKEQAKHLRGRFAFWKGVVVEGESRPDQTPEGATCDLPS